MASIARRADRGDRWQARYRDESGKEHARLFTRKVDAQRWLDTVTASVIAGRYVDPSAGKLAFGTYAEQWRVAQVQHSPGTAELVESHLRKHIAPTFGSRALSSIRRSDVQAWVTERSTALAPSTIRLVYSYLATIFRSAVEDRLLADTPCRRIALPRVEKARVEPLSTDAVEAVIDAIDERWRAALILAAGTGMRQGEVLGLTLPRLDFLRRTVRVEEQMRTPTRGTPHLAPPKTEASRRTIPLPTVVLTAMSEHLRAWPAEPATGLVFPAPDGGGMKRQRFIERWSRAVRAAGLPAGTDFHELRHYYASLLIAHGESVKVVQVRLGHKSALETLDTYGHLWPDSEDSTRTAVDLVLGARADQMRTKSVIN